MTTYTQEEIDQMRATIAEIDAAAAAAAMARQMAYLTPAREIVDSDAFSDTLTALVALKTDYEADGRASIHVDALVMIMTNLRNDVSLMSPAPVQEAAPVV